MKNNVQENSSITALEMWIRKFCNENKITVGDFSDLIGISRAMLYQYMRNGKVPVATLRVRMSNLLGKTDEEFDVACGETTEGFESLMKRYPAEMTRFMKAAVLKFTKGD